jgi:hypothetical protein
LGVKFVCTVYSASGPMVSVVGDDGSGDPLHERCDESDVYEGEVAQVDVVPELVGLKPMMTYLIYFASEA